MEDAQSGLLHYYYYYYVQGLSYMKGWSCLWIIHHTRALHWSAPRAPLERAARSAGARALELYCYGPAGVRSSELYYVGDVPMPGTTLAVKQSGLPEPAEQYIDKCMRAT